MLDFPVSPILLNTLLDSATLCLLITILLLSLVSLAFVFYLTLKSRSSHHLQNFNSLWTVRFLFVFFIFLWSLNELFRLPFIRHHFLRHFFPSLTIPQQASLCKIHVVLSLGLYEPGFLVTLLFLVNVSVKKKTPRGSWALIFVFTTCLPLLASHFLLLFVNGLESHLPEVFRRSSVIFREDTGHEIVLCGYPLMSGVVFGGFMIWYCLYFSLSYFKVVTLVINNGLRSRIDALAIAVMVSLPLQVIFLGLSSLWRPDQKIPYGATTLLVLIFASVLAAVGEGIVVIIPIIDSLAAGNDLCPRGFDCNGASRREKGCGRLEADEQA